MLLEHEEDEKKTIEQYYSRMGLTRQFFDQKNKIDQGEEIEIREEYNEEEENQKRQKELQNVVSSKGDDEQVIDKYMDQKIIQMLEELQNEEESEVDEQQQFKSPADIFEMHQKTMQSIELEESIDEELEKEFQQYMEHQFPKKQKEEKKEEPKKMKAVAFSNVVVEREKQKEEPAIVEEPVAAPKKVSKFKASRQK